MVLLSDLCTSLFERGKKLLLCCMLSAGTLNANQKPRKKDNEVSLHILHWMRQEAPPTLKPTQLSTLTYLCLAYWHFYHAPVRSSPLLCIQSENTSSGSSGTSSCSTCQTGSWTSSVMCWPTRAALSNRSVFQNWLNVWGALRVLDVRRRCRASHIKDGSRAVMNGQDTCDVVSG